MNYQKHYDALIARARNRVLSGYKESHHVVPRCMGGSNRKSNLVDLTAEEHYVAHQLLMKIYPDNPYLAFAANTMTIRSGLVRRNNKRYGWVKARAVAAIAAIQSSPEYKARLSKSLKNSEALKKHFESIKGIPRTEEVRRKVSEAHKTSAKAAAAREELFKRKVGRPRSEETRKKLSEVQIGKVLTDAHKANIGAALKGRKLSPEQIEQIRARMIGKPGTRRGAVTSEETKAKQRAAKLGDKHTEETKAKMRANLAAMTHEQRSARAHKAWETKRAKAQAQKETT